LAKVTVKGSPALAWWLMIHQAPEGHDGVGGFNSTYLKNISQIGSFPQVGVKKNTFETTT